MFIDTHCHLYLDEFLPDSTAMILRAEKEGITSFLMPAIDSTTYEKMVKFEASFPKKCEVMIGLHPCSVKNDFEKELLFVEQQLAKRKFIAVGEIGLDFYWDKTFSTQQYEAFNRQINWAITFDLPIVIHSRNSIDECIAVVEKNQKGNLRGVFHCFSGTVQQAQQIIDLGFYLGIGGVLTFKNSGLDKVMESIDLKNIVLETDAPYLAPVPFRGKRNESSYLKYVAEKLSKSKNVSIGQVGEITTANAKKIFRI